MEIRIQGATLEVRRDAQDGTVIMIVRPYATDLQDVWTSLDREDVLELIAALAKELRLTETDDGDEGMVGR